MLKKIVLFLFFLLVVSGVISYGILHYHYSDGIRSGRLVKISKKGFLFKTYEGVMDLGSGDQLTWEFSVHDSKLGEELIALSGKNVKLSYTELIYKIFYNTKYNVTAWQTLDTTNSDSQRDFCRLVNLMRKSKSIVQMVRELMTQFTPDLLEKARACQVRSAL